MLNFIRLPAMITSGILDRRCLDAFIVAFHERWFTCTKQLQLTALHFCVEYRDVTIVHLRVDASTPRRLLTAADTALRSPDRRGSTRIPQVRARRVTWKLTSAAMLSRPIDALSDLQVLSFGPCSTSSVQTSQWWPSSDKRVRPRYYDFLFGPCMWPACEWQPFLGEGLDESNVGASRSQLRTNTLEHNFNGSLLGVSWPASLLQLALGFYFDQAVIDVEWPPLLQQLSFGHCFNQAVEGATWPASLQVMSFGTYFNQAIELVVWPVSLKQLQFGTFFNQATKGVVWPVSLKQFECGKGFVKAIEGVTWPESLRQLTFGCNFNHGIEGVTWPASLEQLVLVSTLPNRSKALRGRRLCSS